MFGDGLKSGGGIEREEEDIWSKAELKRPGPDWSDGQ